MPKRKADIIGKKASLGRKIISNRKKKQARLDAIMKPRTTHSDD